MAFSLNNFGVLGYDNTQLNQRLAPLPVPPQATQPQPFANPFTSAMSGNQAGTLQPFINQQVQSAQEAQGGGLLNFMPQQYQAGNAGGDVQQPTLPNQLNLAQLLQGLGHRSWMP